MTKPYRLHLHSSADLKTTYEAIRAGFVALALEKNRRATPYVAEARALKSAAARAKKPADLLNQEDIQGALVTASGLSDKASGHLRDAEKREAIEGLISEYLEPAGALFVEELVFRFLLIRGDALGGSMRNVGGAMAQKKLTRAIISYLMLNGSKCQWRHSETKCWAELPKENADIENQLCGLSWTIGEQCRTLLYNLTVPLVKNNIDLTLFDCAPSSLSRETLRREAAYLAFGELKGGIDPAGADEHWKTARTALDRIRSVFTRRNRKPALFFVGAAIESKMAAEIWRMLKDGKLTNAANLTNEEQINSLSRWLCGI